MVPTPLHRPVMLGEALEALRVRPDGRYVDATFGRGGHATVVVERLGSDGALLALDKDPAAIAAAQDRFGGDRRIHIRHCGFRQLREQVEGIGWLGRVCGILLDLGVSSPQLDDSTRGFSFRQSGPLDMRMDSTAGQTAAEWLASAAEGDISHVLRVFGEERYARRIARAIVAHRSEAALETTDQLAKLVASAVPTRERSKDPATRTFQALRIFINGELDELQEALIQALDCLEVGGRLVVISFHSLEDRIVKRFMRDQERGVAPGQWHPAAHYTPLLKRVGKAVRPGEDEVQGNVRARSAIMRVAERV